MADEISLAPTGRATCKRCMKKIDKGTLRFTHSYPSYEFDGEISQHYHARCAMDEMPEVLYKRLQNASFSFPEKGALLAEASALIDRLNNKQIDQDNLAPMADAQGRPKGRLLFCTGTGVDPSPASLYGNRANEFTSPSRSYKCVLPHGNPLDMGLEDPAVPILGGVIVTTPNYKNLILELPRFSLWRQRRLPSPAIWLIAKKNDNYDEVENSLRQIVSDAGFSGDDSRFVVSAQLNASTLNDLALELDDALPSPTSLVDDRSPTRRALDTIVELDEQGRYDAIAIVARILLENLDHGYPERDITHYFYDFYGSSWDSSPNSAEPWRLGASREVAKFELEPALPEHIAAMRHSYDHVGLKKYLEPLLVFLGESQQDDLLAAKKNAKKKK